VTRGRRWAGSSGRSRGGKAPGSDLAEAATPLGREREGMNEGNRLVHPHLDPLTQGEKPVGPESPSSRHQSLRGVNPGVSGLPRPYHLAVFRACSFAKESMFEIDGIGLGKKKVTGWYLVLMFAKCK
jgi:hypothetical protein